MDDEIKLQVGVKILLKNKEGKYLLLRRSLKKYPEVSGRWDIVGGRIEPGKNLLENLKREIKEETGLELVNKPKLIAAQDILRNNNRHIVRLTYIGETDGEVMLDTDENDAYKWYGPKELKNIEDVDIYFSEVLKNNLTYLI